MALLATFGYENKVRPHPNPLPEGEGISLGWGIFMAIADGPVRATHKE